MSKNETKNRKETGLQSKFGWGFPKANAMIMRLEEDDVVSSLDGNKRIVLIKK